MGCPTDCKLTEQIYNNNSLFKDRFSMYVLSFVCSGDDIKVTTFGPALDTSLINMSKRLVAVHCESSMFVLLP